MNTLLSLKNNVSKIQNLIISGEVGATGPTGPQGNRGTALDVNFFGDLDNTKLAEVLNDSTIDSTNAYVIVVSTDGSTIGTRTNSLTGIDTPGSLSDLSNHLIIFDGLQWVDHGVFASIKGDTGNQGPAAPQGEQGQGIQGPQGIAGGTGSGKNYNVKNLLKE